MRRVYLAQINTSFGDNAFLPYSVGLLWARAMSDDRLSSSYELGGLLCRRLALDETVGSILSPDVLALSCYVWNWRYNMALAESIKRLHPGCLVVLGGPEVPTRSEGFLESHRFVDVLVHGEGEEAFSEVLLSRIGIGDLSDVKGISLRRDDGVTMKTAARQRSAEVDSIPSPYLTGVFDGLVAEKPGINWHASQETHRGCPYSCTFCDWGSAVYTKIREFGTKRLIDEMSWFCDNRIDLLYNCDANYGILKRDIELTRELVSIRKRTGYPRKFRASYAKKSDGKVFEISRMLADAGMSKGVTLSLQSLNDDTLSAVKRGNISMNHFGSLVKLYREQGMPTYTEIILGLPGETSESYVNGLDAIIEAGQHDSINVYPCMVLKNSEMGDPAYISAHGIRSVSIPISGNHGNPREAGIEEYQDIVVSTGSMDMHAWRGSYLMSWLVQALHCLGPTQVMAMRYRQANRTYTGFYALLLRLFDGTDTVLGREIRGVNEILDGVVSGQSGFDRQVPGCGDVLWTPEEKTFLAVASDPDAFYDELLHATRDLWGDALARDLVAFQRSAVLYPHMTGDTVVETGSDMLGFYMDARLGKVGEPRATPGITRFASDRYFCGDVESYAREVVWYGRKQGLQRMKAERLV